MLYQNGSKKVTSNLTNKQPTSNQQATNKQPQINNNNNINNINNNNNNTEVKKIQKLIIETLGSTNLTTIQEAITYLDDLPIEVIEIALKKTAEANANWRYTKTILNNWIKSDINTVEKVQADDLKFRTKNETNTNETDEEKQARKLKELEEALKDDTK